MKTFFISGIHSVISALENNHRVKKTLYLSKTNPVIENIALKKKIPYKQVNKRFIDKLFNFNGENHQNIALEVGPIKTEKIENVIFNSTSDLLILNSVQDPRNIGSVIRTAIAFNINNIIIEKKYFNASSNLMHKSSSGCIDKVNVFLVSNLNNAIKVLKKNDFWIVGLSSHSQETIYNFNWPKKTAFVFGSEQKGMSNNVSKNCDFKIKIPISEKVESLNISNAVASTLAIYRGRLVGKNFT